MTSLQSKWGIARQIGIKLAQARAWEERLSLQESRHRSWKGPKRNWKIAVCKDISSKRIYFSRRRNIISKFAIIAKFVQMLIIPAERRTHIRNTWAKAGYSCSRIPAPEVKYTLNPRIFQQFPERMGFSVPISCCVDCIHDFILSIVNDPTLIRKPQMRRYILPCTTPSYILTWSTM